MSKRILGELIDNASDEQAQERDHRRKAYGELPRQTKTNPLVLNAMLIYGCRGVSAGESGYGAVLWFFLLPSVPNFNNPFQ
jgi:hypothetical protein